MAPRQRRDEKEYRETTRMTYGKSNALPTEKRSRNPIGKHRSRTSPTSVYEDSASVSTTVSFRDDSSSLRSTIAMSETGAEVTLDQPEYTKDDEHDVHSMPDVRFCESPTKAEQRKIIYTTDTALLDVPDPASAYVMAVLQQESPSPMKMSFCGALACCTTNAGCNGQFQTQFLDPTAEHLQSTIALFLESPMDVQDWCGGWQAWSYFYMSSQQPSCVMEADNEEATEIAAVKEDVQRVLKNRAFDLAARRRRLSALRKNLNPFDHEHQQHGDPIGLVKSRSLQLPDKEASRKPTAPPSFSYSSSSFWTASVPPRKTTQSSNLASVWKCAALNCATPCPEDMEAPSPIKPRWEADLFEADDGYDSDPEDVCRNQRFPTIDDRTASMSRIEGNLSMGTRTSTRIPHLLDKENSQPNEQHQIGKDEDVQLAVQEIINERWKLVLHKDRESACPGNSMNNMSVAVNAWIERGTNLCDRIVVPKLFWKRVALDPLAGQQTELSSVDLLDIHRILPVDSIDRRKHPFAKAQHCILIRTLDESVLFEAATIDERDRMIRNLKLVVARLASTLVVRDPRFVDEFFQLDELDESGEYPQPDWLMQSH